MKLIEVSRRGVNTIQNINLKANGSLIVLLNSDGTFPRGNATIEGSTWLNSMFCK
jgi:hypothetical protein